MNTNPNMKLTLLSYSTQGQKFVQFVMACYDETGRAHIDSDFIVGELAKRGLRKQLQCITIG